MIPHLPDQALLWSRKEQSGLRRRRATRTVGRMTGAITGKDVVRHAATIVRLWGWGTWFACLRATVTRKPSTFLRVLYPALQPTPALAQRERP